MEPTHPSINRRAALKRLALLTGGALSASTVAAIMSGCQPRADGAAAWQPRVLQGDQVETLATAADLIIPPTDTPGARAAGVHEYIDMMLADFHDATYRAEFIAGVDGIEATAQATHGVAFTALEEADQVALLSAMESAEDAFWAMLKGQVIVGYYTSELGATQELQHRRVPGQFMGCIPIADAGNGRTWAE
ncbi:MAG: gluconate 2-dehydrogenase subunit 3 family protein [Bacteroidota bacterium]